MKDDGLDSSQNKPDIFSMIRISDNFFSSDFEILIPFLCFQPGPNSLCLFHLLLEVMKHNCYYWWFLWLMPVTIIHCTMYIYIYLSMFLRTLNSHFDKLNFLKSLNWVNSGSRYPPLLRAAYIPDSDLVPLCIGFI